MSSIADPVAGTPLSDSKAAAAAAPAIALPVAGERELRLDLFRGMALWLIFVDHLPTNILTWFTIRNYGFSDATEIFIFISGYTAAFVYGRAMLQAGFVVATARIMRRVWQIYVAHVFLFTIFLAEISYVATRFENPLYSEEMGIMDFLKQPDVTIVQALLLRFRPVNMDVLPLYIVLMLFLPIILWLMKWRPDVSLGAVGAAVRADLAIRLVSDGLSRRLLDLQPVRLAVAVRVRRLVRARRRRADVADPVVAGDAVDLHRLSDVFILRHVDLAHTAAQLSDAEAARTVDVPDHQDRSGRAAVCPFSGAWRRSPCASCPGIGRG